MCTGSRGRRAQRDLETKFRVQAPSHHARVPVTLLRNPESRSCETPVVYVHPNDNHCLARPAQSACNRPGRLVAPRLTVQRVPLPEHRTTPSNVWPRHEHLPCAPVVSHEMGRSISTPPPNHGKRSPLRSDVTQPLRTPFGADVGEPWLIKANMTRTAAAIEGASCRRTAHRLSIKTNQK